MSGKMKTSLQSTILEVENAQRIDEITDCKKLVDFQYVYRIRVGGYRAFLFFMFKSKTMWSCSNIFCLVERLMAKSLKRI